MAVDDDERQPLLASRSEEQRASDHWLTRGVSAIRSSWPVYQAILLLFIYQVSYYSTAAAQIDLVRELTCARYYEQHPNLIDPTDDQRCSSDQIESQAAHILLVLELLVGLGSAVSTIQFGQKFSTWGRKPVLLISLFTIVLFPAVCIVVPRGYPYGPLPSEAIISPTKCIYILAAGCTITGLLGANALPICCYRLLVVDHSDTAERTKNLVYVMVAYLSGLMIGPLISAAASYIAPISALGVDGALISIYHHLFRSNAGDQQLLLTTKAQVGLVTPFIVCLIGGLFSVFYVVFFVKETAFSTQAAAEVGNERSETGEAATTDAPASKAPFTPLQALMPIKQKDGSYDMRIAALFTTMVLVYCGGASLDILVVFFGHAMQWTPSSVGYLISSLGATRLVTVFAVLPSLLVFLERTVRRPTSIAHHTVKELHKISKASSSEETPTDESAYVSERDLDNTRLLQGAISLWRARIDYSIIKLSWITEFVGWLIIAIGATFKEVYTIFAGNVLTGFGIGGQPALQSFGLTVTSDVLAGAETQYDTDREEEESTHHGHAGEIFFSLLSFSESVVSTIMPIINNLIYSATLSTFPAACFIMAAVFYLLAVLMVSTIAIHRHQ